MFSCGITFGISHITYNNQENVMKKQLSLIVAITLLFATSIYLSNCGNKKDDPQPEPNPIEEQLKLLAGTYDVGSVKLDGTDVSADYPGMKITFGTNKSYSTSGGDFVPVWKASGTFTFKNESSNPPDLSSMIRDDNVEMLYTLSGSNITLNFSIKDPNGRLAGLEGQYEFTGAK